MDMDKLVSTESNAQKYTKIFAMILRLRMLCDLGQLGKESVSSRRRFDVPQASSPAESELGSELGCELCQKDESLDLLKDRMFCPSCSRLLGHVARATHKDGSNSPQAMNPVSPQPTHAADVPPIIVQPPNEQQHAPLAKLQRLSSGEMRQRSPSELQQPCQTGSFVDGVYPTKLLAIADNLRRNIGHSKRFVNRLYTLGLKSN